MKIHNKVRFLIYWLRYLKDFIYDLNRFVKFSNIEHEKIEDNDKLVPKIISLYHVIEKGLSMENPRPGFGNLRVIKLIEYINIYHKRIKKINWNIQVISSVKVLNEYKIFNESHNIKNKDLNFFLEKHIDILDSNILYGGTKDLNLNYNHTKEDISFDQVISNRSSIRNFGEGDISFGLVKDSIIQAQKAPSTCNRQSTRLLFSKDKSMIKKLLSIQGGANGFSEKISCLLIVCSETKCYQGSGDRHSGLIDASLYAMTLMYSLTKNKIANISLNWSKTSKEDIALRKAITIPESYTVLFFIGLGAYNKDTKVPISTKNSIDSFLTEIKN